MRRILRCSLVASVALAGFFQAAATVTAQPLRQVVTVVRPNLPRRAAEAAVAGLAKKAYLEAFIRTKMSPALMAGRGDEIRAAFEPVDAVLGNFLVVSQQDQPDGTVRVTCEADVDVGQVLVRLVASKVVSFSEEPPRILLVSAGTASEYAVKALRARLGAGLGQAGFTLLAAEVTPTAELTKWRSSPEGVAWMRRTVAETRADLVGLIGVVLSPAPSTVGGTVLDVEIQYTVMRPRDNAIVAEQVFSARGSGATLLLAQQAVLDDIGPRMAADLSGKLASEVFDGGDVIDGTGALSDVIVVNVFFRPSSQATVQLKSYLEQQGLKVEMGDSSLATIEVEIRNRVGDLGFDGKKVGPADRLVLSGQTSVGKLFDTLNAASLGPEKLKVSVIEYGDNYLGVEVLAPAAPRRAPPASGRPKDPVVAPAVGGARPAASRPPMVFKKKLRI